MKLGELISEHMNRTGESLSELAERAGARGHPLHRATFSKLRNEGKRTEFPEMSTLLAVAAALDIPPEEVALSAMESMGLDIQAHSSDEPYARQFLAITANLSDPVVKRLLSVTRTMAKALEESEAPPDQGAPGGDPDT